MTTPGGLHPLYSGWRQLAWVRTQTGQADSSQRKGALLWGVVPTQLPLQQLRKPPGPGFQTPCSWQEEPLWGQGFSRTQLGKTATQQLCVREHTPSPRNN